MRTKKMLGLVMGLVTLLLSANAFAFSVTPTDNASALVNTILGSGITIVGTPTYTGAGQSGTFQSFTSGQYTNPLTNATGVVNLDSGIIMTSGTAAGGVGNYSGGASNSMGGAGDSNLTTLSGYSTYDAAVLQFSFTSTKPTLYFNFAFASTEYPNYVNSQFNDVFGLYVNGGNIALVPGKSDPIAVNSVNVGNPVGTSASNPQYFTQYSGSNTPFNYGGLTLIFQAQANVKVGEVNTMKFAIADASDDILDSAILIQAGTFGTEPTQPVPEPFTLLLLGSGFVAVVGLRRKF